MRVGTRTGAGIRLKVYGVRVERTETAVHVAFGPIRRDPNRPAVCPCVPCQREHASLSQVVEMVSGPVGSFPERGISGVR
jgi:hypothetical protein